jgi:hypothetical protein
LLQQTAVEVAFVDGINVLLVLESLAQRDAVYALLLQRCRLYAGDRPAPPVAAGASSGGGGLRQMLGGFQPSSLGSVAALTWHRRQNALR